MQEATNKNDSPIMVTIEKNSVIVAWSVADMDRFSYARDYYPIVSRGGLAFDASGCPVLLVYDGVGGDE